LVPLATALRVLRAHRVGIVQDGENTILSKGDSIEVQVLPDPLSRRMVGRLAAKFCDGKIHHFYHPEMAPRE
jgi:hypothetical protein